MDFKACINHRQIYMLWHYDYSVHAVVQKVFDYKRDMSAVKSICNIGQNTLGIFIIHIIVLYYTLRPCIQTMTSGEGLSPGLPLIRYYVIAIIISFIAVIGTYYATRLIKKTRIISKLLLGL